MLLLEGELKSVSLCTSLPQDSLLGLPSTGEGGELATSVDAERAGMLLEQAAMRTEEDRLNRHQVFRVMSYSAAISEALNPEPVTELPLTPPAEEDEEDAAIASGWRANNRFHNNADGYLAPPYTARLTNGHAICRSMNALAAASAIRQRQRTRTLDDEVSFEFDIGEERRSVASLALSSVTEWETGFSVVKLHVPINCKYT
ncbi:hypothetical protein INR49_005629 [Caranx melampygus]|nr:hypothetical protein INR49_005629 [Caranx melampygus]